MTRTPLNEAHLRAIDTAAKAAYMLTRRGVSIIEINPTPTPEIEIDAPPWDYLLQASTVVVRKNPGVPARTLRVAEYMGAHVIWRAKA